MASDDFEAFLHIVHVSDMHCRDGSSATDLRAERLVQKMSKVLSRAGRPDLGACLDDLWSQGVAGHDPAAHGRMCRFLTWFAQDPQFGGVETWLLDTGDLSSMGDAGSLQTAMGWLQKYRSLLGATQWLVLYGNHDAWPAKFPLGARQAELEQHRKQLRSTFFPDQWPLGPLRIEIPHTASSIRLQGINSAIDDRWHNTWARGRVEEDPAWAAQGTRQDQLQSLAGAAERDFHPDGNTRDFRIVAVHHPVHYPPPRPARAFSMMNDREVADALIRFDQKLRGKLAHLVLSGHTHETYPALGRLPLSANAVAYPPLTEGQLQLIAGSLSQSPRAADRDGAQAANFVPHEFQVLTFFSSPSAAPHQLLMERRIVGRPGGSGDYRILAPAGAAVESVTFNY